MDAHDFSGTVDLFRQPGWETQPGASEGALGAAEHAIRMPLPEDLKAVLRWSDGGQGTIGHRGAYLQLLSAAEIAQFQEYDLNPYAGIVCIGNDGSREQIALDYRGDPAHPAVAIVDLTHSDADTAAIRFGASFGDGMAKLAAGRVWGIPEVKAQTHPAPDGE